MSDECYSPNGKGCGADRQRDICCELLRPGACVRMRVYAPRLRARERVGHNRAVPIPYPITDACKTVTTRRARCTLGHADRDGARATARGEAHGQTE